MFCYVFLCFVIRFRGPSFLTWNSQKTRGDWLLDWLLDWLDWLLSDCLSVSPLVSDRFDGPRITGEQQARREKTSLDTGNARYSQDTDRGHPLGLVRVPVFPFVFHCFGLVFLSFCLDFRVCVSLVCFSWQWRDCTKVLVKKLSDPDCLPKCLLGNL